MICDFPDTLQKCCLAAAAARVAAAAPPAADAGPSTCRSGCGSLSTVRDGVVKRYNSFPDSICCSWQSFLRSQYGRSLRAESAANAAGCAEYTAAAAAAAAIRCSWTVCAVSRTYRACRGAFRPEFESLGFLRRFDYTRVRRPSWKQIYDTASWKQFPANAIPSLTNL